MEPLPIASVVDELVQSVLGDVPVVLRAPPGAGKTTGVPPALLQAGIAEQGQILLVQPRRMAARAAARRLARSLNTPLGDRVGYQVRFDNRTGHDTELIAMTTGVLLRRLGQDPLLSDVQCVLLDEFHERSLEADLALGMLQRIRTTFRPELKLVIMSATLDPTPIVHFLQDATSIESSGRAFPVQVIHTKEISRASIDLQVADVIPDALSATDGDVLVFLPGVGEIRRTHRTLDARGVADRAEIVELYGDLAASKQDSVLGTSDRRRIILSTNVAETSLTIPGVTSVVDSGLARVMQFDARVGLPRLQLEPISQASAEQRAGRAGRTQAGVCFRLWPLAMHRSRRERELPEVQRSDLSGALLMLFSWGERDPLDYPWLTPPPADAIERARRLLERLAAIGADNSITELGRRMLRFPLYPRLARFMVEASAHGVASDAAMIAAMLTERDPFRASGQNQSTDLLHRLDQLRSLLTGDPAIDGHREAAKNIARVAKQIERLVPRDSDASLQAESTSDREAILSRALLAAYPDRIARRREAGSDLGVMIGGRGVRLSGGDGPRRSDLFLCIDVDASGKRPESNVRVALDIEESWLDSSQVRVVEEYEFDEASKSVIARRRKYVEDLQLSEVPIACQAGAEVAELLFRHARPRLDELFAATNSADREFVQRVRFLNQVASDFDLPKLDEQALAETLRELCHSRTRLKELSAAPWQDYLRARFTYQQLQQIDQLAPRRIQVPSGNSVAVDYCEGKPVIKVRLQELYGWAETPRVAGGKIPLQLHLLGPNRRPQQITEDLANFWRTTYAQVRKDLRGRYPKHHWPEDPTTAVATRNGLKPRT